MSKYDLIAFDMDGTLLNSAKELSEATVQAVEEAVAAGKTVAISTGRCIAELSPYLHQLKGIRYLITISGALVFDLAENKPVFEQPIPADVISSMLEIAKPYDQMIQMLSVGDVLQRSKYEDIDTYHMRQYHKLYTETATLVDDIYSYYYENRPSVHKINFFHIDTANREAMVKRFAHFDITTVFTEETGQECTLQGISKAKGLTELCRHLSIPVERTIAVGDANNDLEIITAAGLGIAMGNANETVRAAADVVVADCDHDGCVEAIHRYLLA